MDNQLAIDAPRHTVNRRTKTVVVCCVLLTILLAIFAAGLLIGDAAVAPDFSNKGLAPSLAHPFGTDWLGRDMFLRTIKGLSLSITVGAVASAVSAVLATIIGIVAASGSKRLDSAINWLIDLVMGIPHLVLLILISFACGRGLAGLIIGISLTHWPSLARVVRAEVLQIRSQQYIMVSRRLGRPTGWILWNHMRPHIIPQFVVGLVLLFPHAILHESALSFLGYGLPPEQPAIGVILSESMKYLTSGMWWLAIFPGLMLVGLVLLFDKLGDNLKTLLDPASAQE